MAVKISYYEILEINQMATQKEVKDAYRKQAKKYHPDLNSSSVHSEQKFKFINEAYETLSCEVKRNKYDRDCRSQGMGASYEDYIDLGDDLDIKKEKSQIIEVEITLKEAFYGVEKEIEYINHSSCEECNGTGAENGKVRNCPACGGKGVSIKKNGFMGVRSECDSCEGKGYFYISTCSGCEGKGEKGEKERRAVKIPKGVSGGEFVKFKIDEETEVYLKFVVTGEIGFIKHESDLYYKLDISLEDILLGSEHELNYFDEKITCRIPQYSMHKDLIVVKNAGFPILNSNKKGNLVVELNLVYPEITEDLRKTLSKGRK